jgi:hypothetical protein
VPPIALLINPRVVARFLIYFSIYSVLGQYQNILYLRVILYYNSYKDLIIVSVLAHYLCIVEKQVNEHNVALRANS